MRWCRIVLQKMQSKVIWLPRFDNGDYVPHQNNNDSRDRSVPENENYYGRAALDGFDLNRFSASNAEVVDNQQDIAPPRRTSYQQRADFQSEVQRDYGAEQRARNRERAAVRQEKNRKRKKTKGRKKLLRVLAAVVIILLIPTLIVNGILGKIHYDEHKTNQYVTASELKSNPLVKNVLLLGVDARPGQDTTTSHPDTMMLISVDMKHRCIKMTSFLRDIWLYIPSKDGSQRLNTANQQDGYSGIADTIEYHFGIKIDGYVVTNFEMFQQMVDSIGGVEIEVTEEEANEVTNHPGRYGDVVLEAGKHKLTGEQALAYARIRKIDTDFMRTKRQRTVITSILHKAKTNPFRLFQLANGSAPYIETDLSKAQLKRLAARAALCMGNMPQQRVPFDGTWDYATISGNSVIKIDVDANKEKLIDYIYNQSAQEIEE